MDFCCRCRLTIASINMFERISVKERERERIANIIECLLFVFGNAINYWTIPSIVLVIVRWTLAFEATTNIYFSIQFFYLFYCLTLVLVHKHFLSIISLLQQISKHWWTSFEWWPIGFSVSVRIKKRQLSYWRNRLTASIMSVVLTHEIFIKF